MLPRRRALRGSDMHSLVLLGVRLIIFTKLGRSFEFFSITKICARRYHGEGAKQPSTDVCPSYEKKRFLSSFPGAALAKWKEKLREEEIVSLRKKAAFHFSGVEPPSTIYVPFRQQFIIKKMAFIIRRCEIFNIITRSSYNCMSHRRPINCLI